MSLDRVRKLIALTASPNENEARNAAALACKLIRESGGAIVVVASGTSSGHAPAPPPPRHAPPPERSAAGPSTDDALRDFLEYVRCATAAANAAAPKPKPKPEPRKCNLCGRPREGAICTGCIRDAQAARERETAREEYQARPQPRGPKYPSAKRVTINGVEFEGADFTYVEEPPLREPPLWSRNFKTSANEGPRQDFVGKVASAREVPCPNCKRPLLVPDLASIHHVTCGHCRIRFERDELPLPSKARVRVDVHPRGRKWSKAEREAIRDGLESGELLGVETVLACAPHRGRCERCGETIEPGDRVGIPSEESIDRASGNLRGTMAHADCRSRWYVQAKR